VVASSQSEPTTEHMTSMYRYESTTERQSTDDQIIREMAEENVTNITYDILENSQTTL